MKKVIGFLLPVRHVTNFGKPRVELIEFARIILGGYPYLLISWHTSNTLYLRARQLRLFSRFSSGSAYHRLPAGTTQINLVIGNFWRKDRLVVPLATVPTEQITMPPFATPLAQLRPSLHVPLPSPKKVPGLIQVPKPTPITYSLSVDNLSYNI